MSRLFIEKRTETFFRRPVWTAWCAVVMSAGIMLGAPEAGADTTEAGCMQDTAGFSLNCTANDVQIAKAELLEIQDPCDYPGDSVTFTALYDVVVTAKERFDIGLYFAIDGDPNGDGAISAPGWTPSAPGCLIATIDESAGAEFIDLDQDVAGQEFDTCGDINKKLNPLQPVITLTALCTDPDGDGFLNLPNCTSWRQSGANELCTSPLDAFPGSPSKCRCDIGFNVPVPVPAAELLVSKEASPTNVDEPGGSVTFSVSVTNTGVDPENKVTLNSLNDSIYGDITQVQGDVTSTTCSAPQTICPDVVGAPCITPPEFAGTYECAFTANVAGNAGLVETDVVTAVGADDRGNPISGSGNATVTVDDVQPDITVVKTADPTTVLEPGGSVTFSVLVTNDSVISDPVTINSLTDNVHGDLNGQGDCSVPRTLSGAGGTYSCSFTASVTGNSGYVETDTVTASGTDDDENPVSDSGSAVVTVLNVPSEISMVKTANPTAVSEPGGNITYTYKVTNDSPVDTVTINSLFDDILLDLDGRGDCAVPQILGTGETYSCTVLAPVSGNAGDMVTNTATAQGVDDDNEPVMASASATVDIDNVPPAASLIKTATEALVTYMVEVCNDSDAESLTLDALVDVPYGDITDSTNPAISETGCAVPQTLAPADGDASDADCYSCTFKAATITSPTTDTVTGTVIDDDGSVPSTPSDSATVSFE